MQGRLARYRYMPCQACEPGVLIPAKLKGHLSSLPQVLLSLLCFLEKRIMPPWLTGGVGGAEKCHGNVLSVGYKNT